VRIQTQTPAQGILSAIGILRQQSRFRIDSEDEIIHA
jgi:hypothetical protein